MDTLGTAESLLIKGGVPILWAFLNTVSTTAGTMHSVLIKAYFRSIWQRFHCIKCTVMYMCIWGNESLRNLRELLLLQYNYRGSLLTSQISHLLLYPSLWLLFPGLSSQFLPLFPLQPAFKIGIGQYYLREMATKFCKLWEPLNYIVFDFI